MTQPKLPLHGVKAVLYECLNPECFYNGALMNMDDVAWKDVWSSHLEDLELVAFCVSCGEPMAHWKGDDDAST